MGRTHAQPREANLLSDSRSSSQQDRVGEDEDELITALAKQFSGEIGRAEIEQQPRKIRQLSRSPWFVRTFVHLEP